MPSPDANAAPAAARLFVRSLNLLLKYVRLYGADHGRSMEQFDIAWRELQTAVESRGEHGLLLGTSGETLLIDGVPLDGASAEKSFAKLLDTAGISSMQFLPGVTSDELAALTRGFSIAGSKPQVLQESLRSALADSVHVRVNTLKFVAQDAATAGTSAAAQLVAASLGDKAGQLRDLLEDPTKLLQAIAAASSKNVAVASGASAMDISAIPVAHSPQQRHLAEVIPFPSENTLQLPSEASMTGNELGAAFRLLMQIGKASAAGKNYYAEELPHAWVRIPPNAQRWLHEQLTAMAASPAKRPDTPLLLQLAEQLAIRFALERFERGEVRVNAVREMLDRMGKELDSLRSILRAHESTMEKAGLLPESHADILDRQFWSSVPDAGKRSVLLSDDAWCIPPRNIQTYVEELIGRGEPEVASCVLVQYAQCVRNSDPEARRRSAIGLSHLAELYGRSGSLLEVALYQLGEQMASEREKALESLQCAAFVRMSQEAAGKKRYAGVQQTLRSLETLDNAKPSASETLRPRIRINDRLKDFIDDGLSSDDFAPDLVEVLQRVPGPSVELLMKRFSQATRRSECDRTVHLAQAIGPAAINVLKAKLNGAPQQEAALTIGLLSRLDLDATDTALADRVHSWSRPCQSQVVQQIAAAAPEDASTLYLRLLDRVDRLVAPEVIDELGMTCDRTASAALQQIAFAEVDVDSNFMRVKAIEALGRLRDPDSSDGLRQMVAHRGLLGWSFPREIRIAAAQALQKIEPDIAAEFLSDKGFDEKELLAGALEPDRDSPWVRQRRYPRFLLPKQVTATLTTPRTNCRMFVRSLSLGGGAGASESHFTAGTHAAVELQSGFRKVRAQVLLRELPTRELSFEIVRMDLQERNKLRKLLSGPRFAAAVMENAKGRQTRRVG